MITPCKIHTVFDDRCPFCEISTLRTQLKSVEADAAVMREAFAWLEEYFRVNIDGGGRHSCPWCYHKKEDVEQWAQIEHAPECIIGKALCRDTFLNPTHQQKGEK